MNFPCPNRTFCPGAGNLDYDSPVSNLTSEAPDHEIFVGFGFGPWNAGGGTPPLGATWQALGCVSACESSISQEDADLCAQRQSSECTWNNWQPSPDATGQGGGPGTGPGGTPPGTSLKVYHNALAQCSATCPDGSLFTWTILPGQFSATSQAQANAMAQSFACQKVLQHYFCLGTFTPTATVDVPYVSGAQITGPGAGPFLVELVGGALPDGLLMSQNFGFVFLSGIPTVMGTFDFTLRVTDQGGNSIVKSFEIVVSGSETCSTLWARMHFVDNSQPITFSPPNLGVLSTSRVGDTLFTSNDVTFDNTSPAAQQIAQIQGTTIIPTANEITCHLTLNITQKQYVGVTGAQLVVLVENSVAPFQTFLIDILNFPVVQTKIYTVTIPAGVKPLVGIATQLSTTGGILSSAIIVANLQLGT